MGDVFISCGCCIANYHKLDNRRSEVYFTQFQSKCQHGCAPWSSEEMCSLIRIPSAMPAQSLPRVHLRFSFACWKWNLLCFPCLRPHVIIFRLAQIIQDHLSSPRSLVCQQRLSLFQIRLSQVEIRAWKFFGGPFAVNHCGFWANLIWFPLQNTKDPTVVRDSLEAEII